MLAQAFFLYSMEEDVSCATLAEKWTGFAIHGHQRHRSKIFLQFKNTFTALFAILDSNMVYQQHLCMFLKKWRPGK